MNSIRCALLTSLLVALFTGCAAPTGSKEMKPGTFADHFGDQARCHAYVQGLVEPSLPALREKKSLGDWGSWFESQPDELSEAIRRVRAQSGAIDPFLESDQLKVSARLFHELSSSPNFNSSSCGADVRDQVMEALYLGVGGESSVIAEELRRKGIEESYEQRWVMLATLLAGSTTR